MRARPLRQNHLSKKMHMCAHIGSGSERTHASCHACSRRNRDATAHMHARAYRNALVTVVQSSPTDHNSPGKHKYVVESSLRDAPDLRRPTLQCAEVVTILRGVAEKSTEWNELVCVVQLDFARACDAVRHAAIARSMHRRGVPAPVGALYLREIRASTLVFGHIGWHTAPVSPTIGLRQGCGVSPMVFRWIMEDIFVEVQEDWRRRECELLAGRGRLMYICWADDTWLFAKSAGELSYVVQTLEDTAQRMAGLESRLPKCQWTRIHRPGQDMVELRPTPRTAHFEDMQETPAGACMKLVGACNSRRWAGWHSMPINSCGMHQDCC